MNTTSNLLVEGCGVEDSVKEIIEKYGINENHLEHVIYTDKGKQQIIEEAEVYQAAKEWKAANFPQFWYTIDKVKYPNVRTMPSGGMHVDHFYPASYWEWNRQQYYYDLHYEAQNAKEIELDGITEEEINDYYNLYVEKYNIDSKYIPFIDIKRFVLLCFIYEFSQHDGLNLPLNPCNWVWDCWREETKRQKQEEEKKQQQLLKATREERKLKAEAELKEYKAQLSKEEKEYNALAAKGQFLFDNLLIQRQENSTSFLLPNENNKKVTAYNIIERLTGNAFKSYKKQIKFKNNKIQILPLSERIRIVFYFRQQYKKPPTLDNANTVAAFINTAKKYTNNIELNQNWQACLYAANTQEEAANLLVYYGWATTYTDEFPRLENAFYTADVSNGARYYEIVEDDITLRLAAIEQKGRCFEVYEIIADKELQYKEKYSKLQGLLKPLLWWHNDIKMGLTASVLVICNVRIDEYIDNLFEHNAFDGISQEEHINRVEIDKSDTGIVWAEPQQFIISLDDIEFADYKYNINANYNKDNAAELGAARSKKVAERNFSQVVGNEWTTQELYAQGIDKDKITRLIKQKKIERIKQGYYRRILS